MDDTPYRELAARLDELPHGFPPTDDGAELRLLAKLFTPEEAALARAAAPDAGNAGRDRGAAWAAIRRRCADSSRRWPSAG